MHTYTAEEVIRETQGWPKEIPLHAVEDLKYHLESAPRTVQVEHLARIANIAAHAATGAGLVWLAGEKFKTVLESVGRNWWVCEYRYDDDDGWALVPIVVPSLPTPLAAVSAAVRWMMEQRKKGTK